LDILLIPGFMLDGDLWSDIRYGLSAFGRLVDVDTTLDTSIESMADRALSTMSDRAIVIGFSMGGYVARAITYRAPEKVAALAQIATSSAGDAALANARAAASGSTTGFRRLSRAAVASSLHFDHRTDALIDRVQQMSERLGGEVLRRQSQIRRKDDSDRLCEIKCPALIVAAAQDELRTIEESETLHRGIQGASMELVEQSGHLIPLEQPENLLRALRFLCEKAE
jgi:pimeloyl-ACP methyl ester carboxylesterase